MGEKVSDLSVEQLQKIIEDTVKRVLLQTLADPDAGLEVRPELLESLRAEAEAESRGETRAIEDVLAELDETW